MEINLTKKTHRSKDDILKELHERRSEFSKEEVLQAIEASQANTVTSGASRQKLISAIAYTIGALIIIMGVIVLGVQFWQDIRPFARIAVTFILGILIFASAVITEKKKSVPHTLPEALSIAAAMLTSFGFYVVLSEITQSPYFSPGNQILMSILLILMFAGLYGIRRSAVYCFIMTAYSTWFLYALISLEQIQTSLRVIMAIPETIYLYLTSIIGFSYISLAYSISDIDRYYKKISNVFYFFGSFALVIPLFTLSFIYTGVWDLVSVLFILGLLVMGVQFESKSLVVSGGILLAVLILIVSFRYFADTIGWPLTLIVAGILLIASGYLSHYSYTVISQHQKKQP